MAKKYYWLKLKEDFFDDDTISWIEDQENGKDYCLFYLKMCLKSLKNEGVLIRNVGDILVPCDAKQLSKITNTDVDTVVIAMKLFEKIGLIEILENGEIFITQFSSMVGSETEWAQKKRIQRQKKEDIVPKLSGQCPIENRDKENRDKELQINIHTAQSEDCVYVDKSKIKEFSKLYQENIGIINRITRDFLVEASNEIDIELFKRAIEIATEKGKANQGYLKGILRQWRSMDVKTYDELNAYEKSYNDKKKTNTNEKKTGFHNFDETFRQYSTDELNKIIKKSQKEKFGDTE